MTCLPRFRNAIRAVAAAMGIVLVTCVPTRASDTVTLRIVAGEVLAYVDRVDPAPHSGTDLAGFWTGSLTLIVNERRGIATGWQVSIESTDFSAQGQPLRSDFRILEAYPPVVIAGQPVDEGGPHRDPANQASLDLSRRVIWADPGSGSGNYAQRIDVAADIPSTTEAMISPAILTITIGSAP